MNDSLRQRAGAAAKRLRTTATVDTEFKLLKMVSNPPERPWFTVRDVGERYILAVILFYYCLLTRPFSFALYTLRWNCVWYRTFPGFLLTFTLPWLPFVLVGVVLLEQIKNQFKANWMAKGPGAIFYSKPKGIAALVFWELWLNLSMYTSVFLLTGPSSVGIRHSVDDIITTKEFWFAKGKECNARYPKTIFKWNGKQIEVLYPVREGQKVICKLANSYLGIGDIVTQCGPEPAKPEAGVVYFKDYDALSTYLAGIEEYKGEAAFGTEFLQPIKHLGVHQTDILTIKLPQSGKVKVLRCLYWGDCTGHTSHSATSAYFMDIKTERISNPIHWYSVSFKDGPEDKVGFRVPRTLEACAKAVEMHQVIASDSATSWCNGIGWDCMVTAENEPQVFFEGNFAGSRFRRHIFASPQILWATVRAMLPITFCGLVIFGSE